MSYTYIKKDIIGNYFETEDNIELINGYENAVGTVWEDYLAGKFLLLSSEQLQFKAEHPQSSVEEVWNIRVTSPTIPSLPERTLEDAKQELHGAADTLLDELQVFYIDNEPTWFSNRPSVNLQIDADTFDGMEYVDLYDDNGNHIHMASADAKNMIFAIERYDNRCKIFIRNIHSMIDTIPNLEMADNIDVEDYKAQAPETPSFNINIQPITADTYYIQYKLINALPDNDISAVTSGDRWKSTIFPDNGYALLRNDFTAEMGGIPIEVYFEPDNEERIEYASSARIEIENVTGDILIATAARND